ncbi:hypothetical protein HY988_04005 [Candidatus Micrarchaeota archaeon]|nr:hypothetical protein [Candidatus Micrarchaeota archaeon]
MAQENEQKSVPIAKKDVQAIKETKEEIKVASQEIKEAKEEIKKFDIRNQIQAQMSRESAKQIKTKIITVMTTAMAVVSALFWQTAINDTIKTFIPVSGAWEYEIMVAFAITIITAILIYVLSKDM